MPGPGALERRRATGYLDAEAGGPLALWRAWADAVEGRAVDGGHFFPEEQPAEAADALARFFSSTS